MFDTNPFVNVVGKNWVYVAKSMMRIVDRSVNITNMVAKPQVYVETPPSPQNAPVSIESVLYSEVQSLILIISDTVANPVKRQKEM